MTTIVVVRLQRVKETYVWRELDSPCSKYETELSSFIHTVMNNCLSYIVGLFLTSSARVRCMKWAMAHAVIWGHSYSKIFV